MSAFQLGELPEETLELVAEHLENCTRCEAALQTLDQLADPVMVTLRGLSDAEVPPGLGMPTPPKVGDYEILGELGRGGMGVVYRAWDAGLQRVVALKMLVGGEFAQESYRARFRAEAGAVARLRHPNIVQVYEIGEWHGAGIAAPLLYFTLEYVEGGNLSAHLGGKPQAPVKAARWLLTLARAVDHAHILGIVHRDLKPSNVLLTADGQLKLCDFGVAKRLASPELKTMSGLLVGTPEYMAPEQADGQGAGAGPASDVYALGAILYTMLTGRPVFQSSSVLDTLEQVRSQEPVSPRRLQPSVPRDLETICLKCLQKDPRRRFASASELAADLERFLQGRPIQARPAGPLERGWKWARRRPAEAMLWAAVVGVAVIGFALVFWQWQRAESKAAAAASASAREHRARRAAVAEQAELALSQGLSLCERGEISHGLLWLARSLELAGQAGARALDRPIRINLADWGEQLSRPLAIAKHSAAILDLAFSADGGTLISAGKDRNACTWDVESGQETGIPLSPERLRRPQWIGRVAISPSDPNLLVTGDEEGRAIFWDLSTRRESGPPLVHPPGHMIWGLAFRPDGRTLVTCCDDGAVRVWDVASRSLVGEPLRHSEEAGFYTLALSPDGRSLVSGGKDHRALRWDLATGRQLGAPLIHNSPVHTIAYCRDGRSIITGTRDGRLHVWIPETTQVIDLPPQGASITALAVSPDGRTFATGTAGGVVRLWDTTMLAQVGQTHKLVSAVTGLVFRPNGRTLAIGQDDGTIRFWDVPPPKAIGRPFVMGGPVHRVTFGGSGARLLAASAKGARWWDLATESPWGPLIFSERYEPGGMVSSRDGRRTYDILDDVEATALSPDGRLLATACWAGTEDRVRGRAELWNADTGGRLRRTRELPAPLTGVAFSPDAKQLLTWDSQPRSATLWDVATLETSRPVLRALDCPIRQAAFSADGRSLLIALQDSTARLWDVASDREIRPDRHPHHGDPVTAVAFAPRSGMLATACQAGDLRLWDGAHGTLLHDIRGHSSAIVGVAFSPDGSTLLTASHDGTARFWDADSGRQLGPPLRHADSVFDVAFHPDSRSVATGTIDSIAQRWHVPDAPLSGRIDQIRAWVEEKTGLKLDDQGAIHTLYPAR